MIRYLRSLAPALVLAVAVGACGSATEQARSVAMAPRANFATAHIENDDVSGIADIVPSVFEKLNIRFTQREEEPDDPYEIEVEGRDGDGNVTVEIERHGIPETTRIQVSVKRQTDYDFARAQQILSAVLAALNERDIR